MMKIWNENVHLETVEFFTPMNWSNKKHQKLIITSSPWLWPLSVWESWEVNWLHFNGLAVFGRLIWLFSLFTGASLVLADKKDLWSLRTPKVCFIFCLMWTKFFFHFNVMQWSLRVEGIRNLKAKGSSRQV